MPLGALALAQMIGSGLQLAGGFYNSIKSANKMNQYRDLLQSRMALNDAKISQAESPTLSPTGQAYLTAAEQKLKDSTDSLRGIAAVNGGGLDEAKAKAVYGSTLGGLVSDLYSKDYALKRQRLNALEGYGNSLYNGYLNSIAQQGAQNAQAASQLYAGAVNSGVGAFDPTSLNKGESFVPGMKEEPKLPFEYNGL